MESDDAAPRGIDLVAAVAAIRIYAVAEKSQQARNQLIDQIRLVFTRSVRTLIGVAPIGALDNAHEDLEKAAIALIKECRRLRDGQGHYATVMPLLRTWMHAHQVYLNRLAETEAWYGRAPGTVENPNATAARAAIVKTVRWYLDVAAGLAIPDPDSLADAVQEYGNLVDIAHTWQQTSAPLLQQKWKAVDSFAGAGLVDAHTAFAAAAAALYQASAGLLYRIDVLGAEVSAGTAELRLTQGKVIDCLTSYQHELTTATEAPETSQFGPVFTQMGEILAAFHARLSAVHLRDAPWDVPFVVSAEKEIDQPGLEAEDGLPPVEAVPSVEDMKAGPASSGKLGKSLATNPAVLRQRQLADRVGDRWTDIQPHILEAFSAVGPLLCANCYALFAEVSRRVNDLTKLYDVISQPGGPALSVEQALANFSVGRRSLSEKLGELQDHLKREARSSSDAQLTEALSRVFTRIAALASILRSMSHPLDVKVPIYHVEPPKDAAELGKTLQDLSRELEALRDRYGRIRLDERFRHAFKVRAAEFDAFHGQFNEWLQIVARAHQSVAGGTAVRPGRVDLTAVINGLRGFVHWSRELAAQLMAPGKGLHGFVVDMRDRVARAKTTRTSVAEELARLDKPAARLASRLAACEPGTSAA